MKQKIKKAKNQKSKTTGTRSGGAKRVVKKTSQKLRRRSAAKKKKAVRTPRKTTAKKRKKVDAALAEVEISVSNDPIARLVSQSFTHDDFRDPKDSQSESRASESGERGAHPKVERHDDVVDLHAETDKHEERARADDARPRREVEVSLREERTEETRKQESKEAKEDEVIDEEESNVLPPSRIMRFFKTLIIFFLGASFIGGAVSIFFLFFYGGVSGDVALRVRMPDEISRGVPFDLEIELENKSDGLLSAAQLSVLTPPDVLILHGDARNQVLTQTLGDVGADNTRKETIRLVVVEDESAKNQENNESKKQKASVAVRLAYDLGRSTGFELEEQSEIRILPPAIEIETEGEGQVLSGSAFQYVIGYKNTSGEDLEDLRLAVEYPDSFTYVSSDLEPDSLNNYWKLGDLRAGSEGRLAIQGRIIGSDGEEFSIPVKVFAGFLGSEYLIGQYGTGVRVAPSPVGLDITVNGSSDHVARVGETLRYRIQYTNDSGVALSNFALKVSILGEMFDFRTLRTSSTLDSRNRYVWDASNVPEFAELSAGARGDVEFTIDTKDAFSIQRFGDKNFELKVEAEASSPTVPYYLSGNRTRAQQDIVTKVQGEVSVDAKALYRDANAGVVNGGQVPPRVGQDTEYTIHWVLRNQSTDVRDIFVRASLPLGVEWTGRVKSTTDAVPLYDELTREVSWTLDGMSATEGILSAPQEGIFQVRIHPDAGQVGQVVGLLGETRLRAVDQFTGIKLEANDFALTTALLDDPSVGVGQGIVIE